MSSCSCIYVGDYDGPSVYREELRTAAKNHKCCECGREIVKGEKYRYHTGCWDGEWSVYKTCCDCESVREVFFCEGEIFSTMWEFMREHIYGGDCALEADCIARLTKPARDRV